MRRFYVKYYAEVYKDGEDHVEEQKSMVHITDPKGDPNDETWDELCSELEKAINKIIGKNRCVNTIIDAHYCGRVKS